MADRAGDEKRKMRYYTRFMDEFSNSLQGDWLRREYAPDHAIQQGKPIPQFSFASLDDSSQTYTSERLRGKVYLIDFWGIWCAPCIEEMPYLHEAYQEYHDRGFGILSIAFYDDEQSIQSFREKKWPMPWMHTLVKRGAAQEQSVRDKFEVNGFPRTILVDESGRIIATNQALRGEKLSETLVHVLGEKE